MKARSTDSIRTRDTTMMLAELGVLLDAEKKVIGKQQASVERQPTATAAFQTWTRAASGGRFWSNSKRKANRYGQNRNNNSTLG